MGMWAADYFCEQRSLCSEVGPENRPARYLFVTIDFSISLTELLEFNAVGICSKFNGHSESREVQMIAWNS